MAADDAKRFLDHVDRDSALQAKMKEAHASFVQVAKDNGYDVSQADLHEQMRERWGIEKPPSYDDPDTTTFG